MRAVAGAEGFWVVELRVWQLKIGSKSCLGFFPSCTSWLAKCKQILCNIFITSLPKVTKNKKQKMGWTKHKIGKIYPITFLTGTWLPSPKVSKLELLTVVRYLGVTPTSSSVPTLVLSICQQICYHMEVSSNLFFKEQSFRSRNTKGQIKSEWIYEIVN